MRALLAARGQTAYEACIVGAGGQEYGVALYEHKGAEEKSARFVDAGRMRDAANLGSLAVTLDDEPRWAAWAIGDAFDAECVPVPLRVSARVTAFEPQMALSELTEDEVLQLALEAQRAARRARRQSASKRGGTRPLRGPSATGQQTRA